MKSSQNMVPPTTKKEMKERMANGEFGNTVGIYKSYSELVESGYRGNVYIRTNVKMDSLRAFEVPYDRVTTLGVDLDRCHFYESPTGFRLLQGELYRNHRGLYLYWSRRQEPLRTALEIEGRHARGLSAKAILQANLREESVDHLYHLLSCFDGAIIEFTEFEQKMGTLNKSLCVWEVRNY